MKKTAEKAKTKKVKTPVMEIDKTKLYSLKEALEVLPKISTSKFVGTVNVDVVLNLKEKQLKESLKGSAELPNKFGETKKIVVLCEEKDVSIAKKAGAVDAGLTDLVEKMMANKVEYDVVIATPSVMPKIVALGKILGPKGLMPNPKNGTISTDVEKAVASFMGGKINFKMEQGQGVIRAGVAKLDMTAEQMTENVNAFLKAALSEAKKFGSNPFKQITLSPTMGAGVKLDLNDIIANVK